jgi:hypothetical protein
VFFREWAFSVSHCTADLRAADASRQFDDRPLESGDGGVVIAAGVFVPPPGAADQKLFSLLNSLCLLSIGSVIADANCGQLSRQHWSRVHSHGCSKLRIASWQCWSQRRDAPKWTRLKTPVPIYRTYKTLHDGHELECPAGRRAAGRGNRK